MDIRAQFEIAYRCNRIAASNTRMADALYSFADKARAIGRDKFADGLESRADTLLESRAQVLKSVGYYDRRALQAANYASYYAHYTEPARRHYSDPASRLP